MFSIAWLELTKEGHGVMDDNRGLVIDWCQNMVVIERVSEGWDEFLSREYAPSIPCVPNRVVGEPAMSYGLANKPGQAG